MDNKFKGKALLTSSNKADNLPEEVFPKKSTRKALKRKITRDNCENQIPKKPRTRTSIIQTLVGEASRKIGYSKKKTKTTVIENEFEGDSQESEVIFPHISATNWKHFEDTILHRNVDKVTKKLTSCRAKMQFGEHNTHFTGFRLVQAAIVDALLNRKWDNLLKLTVMLGRSYFDPAYRMFIRNLCQILKQYHPAIRGTDYADQLDLIVEKHSKKRKNKMII